MKIGDLFAFLRGEQFKPRPSADLAKQRLQLILAYERPVTRGDTPDFLPMMQREILEVIKKYVPIDENRIKVEVEREQDMSMLAVSIELPHESLSRAV